MERTFESARALARAAEGPLAPHIDAYVSWLIEQQYSALCVHVKTYRAADFSAWLASRRRDEEPYEQLAARYHRRRARLGRRTWLREVFELRQLLGFLRERGLIADVAPSAPSAIETTIARFAAELLDLRGLSDRTVNTYAKSVRRFLRHYFDDSAVSLSELSTSDVVAFVQELARRMPPHQVQVVTTALRALLRHAQMHGQVGAELVAAVPAVASWACTPALPRAITEEHARRALACCDVHTAVGRRDRAVLLLLGRLGLRSGEVAALMLDDVDWTAGCLRVRGKGRREDRLPLPPDVGEAIAAYLRDGRPRSADRHLFLRSRAPIRGFKNSAVAVASIVEHALQRADIDAPRKGAHQFRHALATRLLREGASLPEIAEVLRHRGTQMTAVYARVDLTALRALAPAWPGAAS